MPLIASDSSGVPERVLIVGAGGFGREVLTYVRDVLGGAHPQTTMGFVDDDLKALDGYDTGASIVSTVRDYEPQPTDGLIMALGAPRTKLSVAQLLMERGARFLTLIHPTAYVGQRVTLGEGVVLCPMAGISCDVSIGDFVALNGYATLGHDVTVGEGCTLSAHIDVTGCAQLGRGVFLGSHATVLPGVQVGDFATVGVGSAVIKRVKPGQTVIGVPAKALRL